MSKVKHIEHKDFEIPFSGLKTGIHQYDFDLGKEFFDSNDLDELIDADIQVSLKLEKKPNMLQADFEVVGQFNGTCDRCGNDVKLGLNNQGVHIYKFGQGESDDDEVTMLGDQEHRINVEQPIYELCFLGLPKKQTCEQAIPKQECNPEVLKKLEELQPGSIKIDNSNVDPIWEKLKDLNK